MSGGKGLSGRGTELTLLSTVALAAAPIREPCDPFLMANMYLHTKGHIWYSRRHGRAWGNKAGEPLLRRGQKTEKE